jgi:hypothetical protein
VIDSDINGEDLKKILIRFMIENNIEITEVTGTELAKTIFYIHESTVLPGRTFSAKSSTMKEINKLHLH